MIIIHSPDIDVARGPLQVIHKTWWQHFGYESDPDISQIISAAFDLELANRTELTTQELSDLRQLSGTPSIVVTASLRVIPNDILNQVKSQNRLVGLIGTSDERATETFVYLHRTNSNFVYARADTSTNFYQSMFQQLCIYISEANSPSDYSVSMNYSDLPTLSAYQPLLAVVAADRSLTIPDTDISAWFNPLVAITDTVAAPVDPTNLKPAWNQAIQGTSYLNDFKAVWQETVDFGTYSSMDYTQVLSASGQTKFTNVIDYLNQLHD